jgi:hypothetical protein
LELSLFSNEKNVKKDYRLFVVFALTIFLVICIVAFQRGPISSPDTESYARLSHVLIEKSFNLREFYVAEDFITPLYFYTVTVVLVAALQLISPHEWKILFLLVNLASIGIVLTCVFAIGRILAVRGWILCIVPLLFLAGDALLWPAYILSDTYYAAMVMLALVFLIKAGWQYRVALIFMLLMILITRPTGPAVLVGVIAAMVMTQFDLHSWTRSKLAILFLSGLVAAAVFHGLVMKLSATGWIENEQIAFIRMMVAKGQIIHDRPETWLAPSTEFFDMVLVFLVRFVSFFQPWVLSYSLSHNVANFVFISSFVMATCVFSLTEPGNRDNLFHVQLMLIVIIFSGAIYHSATLIDYDWRYRFAYVVPIALFNALAAEQWLRRAKMKMS